MKLKIRSFCEEYDYPREATETLLAAYDDVKRTEFFPLFQAYVNLYNEDDPALNYTAALNGTKKISEQTGINRYTLNLLLFICFTPHLRELYDEAGLPVEIYHNSVLDLKWKMQECHNVYGVWGSFVAEWFPRFFELSRFALGRLQFEADPSMRKYQFGEYRLNYGDWVLNVHIPSSGKLSVDDCMTSFRKAAEFYADCFPDGVAKFTCHSWLLADVNETYLAPESNILKFKHLFDVVENEDNEKGSDLWRIFHRPYEGSTEGFPDDTSLQRAYLNLLADGKKSGWGRGYLLLKDGKIVTRK